MYNRLKMEELTAYEPHQLVTVFNPTGSPFVRHIQGQTYTIPARDSLELPRFAADNLTKHLVDKMLSGNSVILNTDKDKLYKKIRLYD